MSGAGTRFGVFLVSGRFPGQQDAQVLRRSVRLALAAEHAGFDDVWFAEHHFMSYGVCPSALTLAGHVLGRTRTIEVGTAVSVLSTTHPVALAEQWSMLDAVSDGRVRLGVGRGGPWVDLEVFGTGLDRYDTGFAESLDLLLAATRGPTVSAAGSQFAFRQVELVPRAQQPVAPVVACGSPNSDSVLLAARRGLPMLLGMHADAEEKACTVQAYRDAAGAHAVPHISTVLCQVGDDRRDAERAVLRSLPGWLGPGLAAHRPVDGRARARKDPAAYAERLCAIHPVGGAAECADRLAGDIRRTGVSHVIMMVEATGTPERTLENLERIGAEVLPAVRANTVSSPAVRGSG
ncbi:Flavin-dependent oxidoreductase, luciferase family (includes alkanesulfonate monooxygenase SsuD and methylene tetrahydromethanopterin reductase) [Amycolatopsis marina]|uniref:Flavin-dependent oxidoreductase, luciferase family (Includes alkanesulfonate monooxygenase SsuD and methylene tetrahydromethanopterin reductase) n=1 Tax=Amycolatopsis marina TaxID=490629 RepID=A0A1I0VZY0_9PSEU|nr:LLM class flavin-dependent oxidoreductase [Amycolatopsis marina]SFA81932.1 Flavin-dependent oxidoreductase, luciferase family (includes alkanesulfonate monooxygenase SsuD and methylene tetrahydromethanopterin reductase) [Amycolatopsis marina]